MKHLIAISFILISTNLLAKSLELEKSFTVRTTSSLEDIYKRIFDYQNSCHKGCKYFLPSVKEMKILKDYKYTSHEFYTWTYIDDFMNSKFFSYIEITKDNTSITIKQNQVKSNFAKEISRETGLENSPLLDSTHVIYKLELSDNMVIVNYKIKVSFSKTILRLSKSKIKKGLKKTAKAIEKNLQYDYRL